MAENDLISKCALLRHLDMAMECENCPRNANKELYKCVHNSTSERCTCSDIAQICIRITEFATFADVQPISQWISVKDRLPEIGMSVLIYYQYWDGDIIRVAKLKDDGMMFDVCGAFNIRVGAVTHWKPLPEPPKDGDTNG